ncbi:hypothetical protein JCM18899A_31490 [Nocardioides sp. AN3]
METAQTADYALRVLLELERHQGELGDESNVGLSVTELARGLELNRAVVQRVVATLHRRALLTRCFDGKYVLGPGLLNLGRGIPHELAHIAKLALVDLAESAEEMVVLSVPEGDESVVVARQNGNHGPLRIEYAVGFRHSMARGASGLAMLAFMRPAVAARLMPADDLPKLERIRQAGYALTHGEIAAAMVGVAVPIRLEDGKILGSVAAVLPNERAEGAERLVPQLVKAAEAIQDEYVRQVVRAGKGHDHE